MTSEAILQGQLDECRKELEKERSRSEKLVKKLQESHLRHGQLVRRPPATILERAAPHAALSRRA